MLRSGRRTRNALNALTGKFGRLVSSVTPAMTTKKSSQFHASLK